MLQTLSAEDLGIFAIRELKTLTLCVSITLPCIVAASRKEDIIEYILTRAFPNVKDILFLEVHKKNQQMTTN